MTLLDLPSELLCLIIELALPEGFEGIAVSCKAIYKASQASITKHNRLKRLYTRVRIEDWTKRCVARPSSLMNDHDSRYEIGDQS